MSLDGKITLTHNGQTYAMSFSYKALCIYEEQMPTKNGFVTLTLLLSNGIQRGVVTARDLRALVFGGLSVHHPDMTLDLAGEILDSNPEAFARALQAAMPQPDDTPPEAKPEKPVRPKRRRTK